MKLHKDSFLLLLILFFGLTLSFVLFTSSKRTNLNPKAGQVNLNTASEIGRTLNSDGTMGPISWAQNWSSKLAQYQKGKLALYVTDPWPFSGGRPVWDDNTTPVPTGSGGEDRTPTIAETSEGVQTVSSLVVNFYKAEVRLSPSFAKTGHTGTPGPEDEGSVEGFSTITITPRPLTPGQGQYYWETLNLSGHKSVDLVKLAETSKQELLGETALAAGQYTEIRLYINSATAKIGGKEVDLTILGNDKIVRVVQPFSISAGQTTKLTVDIDAQNSVFKSGINYLLRPFVKRIILE